MNVKSLQGGAFGFLLFVASPMAAATGIVLATPNSAAASVQAAWTDDGNGDNQGGNQQGQNQDGQGQDDSVRGGGVATPELPSGVLVAIGLVPLVAGAALLGRRRLRIKSR